MNGSSRKAISHRSTERLFKTTENIFSRSRIHRNHDGRSWSATSLVWFRKFIVWTTHGSLTEKTSLPMWLSAILSGISLKLVSWKNFFLFHIKSQHCKFMCSVVAQPSKSECACGFSVHFWVARKLREKNKSKIYVRRELCPKSKSLSRHGGCPCSEHNQWCVFWWFDSNKQFLTSREKSRKVARDKKPKYCVGEAKKKKKRNENEIYEKKSFLASNESEIFWNALSSRLSHFLAPQTLGGKD